VPCLMLIACQESLKYFSKIWACLVGSVSNLPVSESFTAWRLARGCAFLSLKIFCELSLVHYFSAAAAFNEQYCCLFCCEGHLYW